MRFPLKQILTGIGMSTSVAHSMGLPVPDIEVAIDLLYKHGASGANAARAASAAYAGDGLLAKQVAGLESIVLEQQAAIALLQQEVQGLGGK